MGFRITNKITLTPNPYEIFVAHNAEKRARGAIVDTQDDIPMNRNTMIISLFNHRLTKEITQEDHDHFGEWISKI